MSQVYEEIEEEKNQTTFQEEASNISKIINVVWAQRNNIEWSENLAETWKYQEVSSPITYKQKERLVSVYNPYQDVFSERTGKVKYYQCTLRIRQPVSLNQKSYPIPYN